MKIGNREYDASGWWLPIFYLGLAAWVLTSCHNEHEHTKAVENQANETAASVSQIQSDVQAIKEKLNVD